MLRNHGRAVALPEVTTKRCSSIRENFPRTDYALGANDAGDHLNVGVLECLFEE